MFKPLLLTCFLVFLVCTVLANPVANGGRDDDDRHRGDDHHRCLSQEQGDKILSAWINFFVNKVDPGVAAKYLSPDFHEYSESINSVSPGKGDTVRSSISSNTTS
jgi:hypothetical protein